MPGAKLATARFLMWRIASDGTRVAGKMLALRRVRRYMGRLPEASYSMSVMMEWR